MTHGIHASNEVHPTAKIGPGVVLGRYNRIGANVVIGSFKGADGARVELGDCNIFLSIQNCTGTAFLLP